MPTERPGPGTDEHIEIDLRQPGLAAFWAWLWPGAGHLYQRRYAKGILFMVCILSTYFYGLAMAGGHVVYASWKAPERRWQYFCQFGVGLPALPALVQARRMATGDPLLFDGIMAPPQYEPFMQGADELSKWHLEYKLLFELGTLYTMIAGLLNVLAIYDAYAGPVWVSPDEKKKDESPEGQRVILVYRAAVCARDPARLSWRRPWQRIFHEYASVVVELGHEPAVVLRTLDRGHQSGVWGDAARTHGPDSAACLAHRQVDRGIHARDCRHLDVGVLGLLTRTACHRGCAVQSGCQLCSEPFDVQHSSGGCAHEGSSGRAFHAARHGRVKHWRGSCCQRCRRPRQQNQARRGRLPVRRTMTCTRSSRPVGSSARGMRRHGKRCTPRRNDPGVLILADGYPDKPTPGRHNGL